MRVLYITYTGLSENLGKSQILPYLIGLARQGVEFEVISFESEVDFEKRSVEVRGIVAGFPIQTYFINRKERGSVRQRFFAIVEGVWLSIQLARKKRPHLIHSRNAIAAECALAASWIARVPYLFDLRGFWGDARRESGQWDARTVKGRMLYAIWKRRERNYLRRSDITNCLTEKAKRWIVTMGYKNSDSVIVTPCCVDFDVVEEAIQTTLTKGNTQNFTCVYLGSMGGVYDDARIFRVFDSIRKEVPGARLCFLGSCDPDKLIETSMEAGVELIRSEFDVVVASNQEVFRILDKADIGLSFCKPGFFASGVSSTKISEYLAVGLPVICNEGIGDAQDLLNDVRGGLVLKDEVMQEVDDHMVRSFVQRLAAFDRGNIRKRARVRLDINAALSNYKNAYIRLKARGNDHD